MKHEKKKGTFGQERFELAKKHQVDLANVQNIQQLLKEGFKDLLEGALQAEFDGHMGDKKYTRNHSSNARNGNGNKVVQSNFGQFQIENPRDRESSFEPQICPKELRILLIAKKKLLIAMQQALPQEILLKLLKIWMGLIWTPHSLVKLQIEYYQALQNENHIL